MMPLLRFKEERDERSAGRTRVEYQSSSTAVLGHTSMAPNSSIARPCPGPVGIVVSTSKNAISNLSSLLEPIAL